MGRREHEEQKKRKKKGEKKGGQKQDVLGFHRFFHTFDSFISRLIEAPSVCLGPKNSPMDMAI